MNANQNPNGGDGYGGQQQQYGQYGQSGQSGQSWNGSGYQTPGVEYGPLTVGTGQGMGYGELNQYHAPVYSYQQPLATASGPPLLRQTNQPQQVSSVYSQQVQGLYHPPAVPSGAAQGYGPPHQTNQQPSQQSAFIYGLPAQNAPQSPLTSGISTQGYGPPSALQTHHFSPQQQNIPILPSQQGNSQPSSQAETNNPEFWGKLITPQRTASPVLILYITALYNYLDQAVAPSNQGGLSPEKIGRLGDIQGYSGGEGIYGSLKAIASYTGQGSAFIDAQFITIYDAYSVAYSTIPRPPNDPISPPSMPGTNLLSSFLPSSPMPLLTLPGLVSLTTLNILRQPHKEWVKMTKVLSSPLLLHPGTGMTLPREVKREAFPETEDREAVERNRMCEEVVKRRNDGDARNMNMAARQADLNSARMRGDVVWTYDGYGGVRYL